MSESAKDEVSLKEIILLVVKWGKIFLSQWILILVFAVIGASIGLTLAFFSKPVYTAELTLALEEKGSGGGAYAGLASQFGLDMGTGGGAFSGENNIELLKSRYLIEEALFTPVVIDNHTDLLINRYIKFNKLDEAWKKNAYLADVSFNANESRDSFSIKKDSILGRVYKTIKNSYLTVSKLDKKLAIITVKVTCEDELFAKLFTEAIVETSSNFYVLTKTKRFRQNLEILQNRLDSVRRELDKEMYGAALSKDKNLNTIRAEANIQSAKKQLNVQVLTTMYSELVKNTEMAKYTLLKEEPLVQIIDRPILPLDYKRQGKLISLIVGGFLGVFASICFIWIRQMKQTIMDGL